ncbi:hypothetical protein CVT25_006087 [Psilocybe cyanescens]|uniref:Arginyl-tRNA synthetase catalytic core domain-containing protein n=1 Tax=Psilocybe cyanescens TaxID=93625 RepID=A0A409X9V8_PSICY|nr:hypothetical protein CVT25_006087 [Psilocybe cyanescens]
MASSVPPLPTVSSTDPSKIPGELEETAAEVIKHFRIPGELEETAAEVIKHIDTPTCNVPSGLPKYDTNNSGRSKKVIIEPSSLNIAKSFHVGHLLSTIIGAFLVNLYKACGWNDISMNYLGHWGAQFGLIATGFENTAHKPGMKEDDIKHLFNIYAAITKDALTDPAVKASALNWFKTWKTETKTPCATGAFGWCEAGGVGEVEAGQAVVRKKDGKLVYLTRDIGGAITRYETYKFDKMKYVVFSQQDLHLSQFFVVLELPLGVLAHADHLPALTRNEHEENGGGVFGQDH